MTVYVDNAGPAYAGCPYASWWSHLWADTVAELDDIATRLGLSPVMRHDPASPGEALPANDATPDRPHYELTDRERTRAILFGACTVPAAPTTPSGRHRRPPMVAGAWTEAA
jgi:hypothetical protein